MKKSQAEALQRECDTMIETSLKKLQASKEFVTDQYTFNLRQALNCSRLHQQMIEQCMQYFEMLGMQFVFKPAYGTFTLGIDLLNSCVMNPVQAKKFNEIFKPA